MGKNELAIVLVLSLFFLSVTTFPTKSRHDIDNLDVTDRFARVILEDAEIIEFSWDPDSYEDSYAENSAYADIIFSSIHVSPKLESKHNLCLTEISRYPNGTLMKAILAAEIHNRSTLRRWLENLFATISFEYFGTLPDLSLGIAQLRPSVATTVLQKRSGIDQIDENTVLDHLRDSCASVSVMDGYLNLLFAQHDPTGARNKKAFDAVLSAYNGQTKASFYGQRYNDIVLKAFSILGGTVTPDEAGKKESGEEKKRDDDVSFQINFATGTSSLTTEDKIYIEAIVSLYRFIDAYEGARPELNSDILMTISSFDDGLGSDDFRSALAVSRADAIRTVLLSSGIDPGNIVVVSLGGEGGSVSYDATIALNEITERFLFALPKKLNEEVEEAIDNAVKEAIASDAFQEGEDQGVRQLAAMYSANLERIDRWVTRQQRPGRRGMSPMDKASIYLLFIEALELQRLLKETLVSITDDRVLEEEAQTTFASMVARGDHITERLDRMYQKFMGK